MDALGVTIRHKREALGLSQRELAHQLGICFVAISKWERGVAYHTADKIPTIADALGCSIDALYGRDEQSAS